MDLELEIPSEEFAAQKLTSNTLRTALQTFNEQGALYIKKAFDPALISSLHQAYLDQFGSVDPAELVNHGLTVGERRYMLPVQITAAFNDPVVYANPLIGPILLHLLGQLCVIDSFGVVTALPGSATQHAHADNPGLFDIEQFDYSIPTYAITVAIPLIDLNLSTGSTHVLPGSHRKKPRQLANGLSDMTGSITPYPSIGDCVMWDYRTVHSGEENRSDEIRPLLYIVYSRHWFSDLMNFKKVKPINMSSAEYAKVPSHLQHLLSRSV